MGNANYAYVYRAPSLPTKSSLKRNAAESQMSLKFSSYRDESDAWNTWSAPEIWPV